MSEVEPVSLLAVIDGEPVLRAGVVVRRDQRLLHVAVEPPMALPGGSVVGVLGTATTATLAVVVVIEGDDPDVMAVRTFEQRC